MLCFIFLSGSMSPIFLFPFFTRDIKIDQKRENLHIFVSQSMIYRSGDECVQVQAWLWSV